MLLRSSWKLRSSECLPNTPSPENTMHALCILGLVILAALVIVCLAAVFCAPSLEDMDVERL